MPKSTLVLVAFLSTVSALAAVSAPGATRSESQATTGSERHYRLDPIELTPVTGFTVVDGSAGFNLGAYGAYPLLSRAPLFFEPGLTLGFFSSHTAFNLSAGARYDINLADTHVRPFARVALGPTFQTSGSVGVFNASFGGGALIPLGSNLELRAEASLVDIDGNAGVQILGGISL